MRTHLRAAIALVIPRECALLVAASRCKRRRKLHNKRRSLRYNNEQGFIRSISSCVDTAFSFL
jgi:hypothetical protein